MKNIILTLIAISLFTQLQAQKLEVTAQANSGLFHYSGNFAAATSFINVGSTSEQNYTNNPYGSRNGFSYGIDGQAQYVFKSGFITGLQAGYEILRSQVNIDDYQSDVIYPETDPGQSLVDINGGVAAKGQTFLQTQFIYLNPYIGYRLNFKKIKVDLMPGIDIGFNINRYDKGKATATDGGNTVTTNYKLTKAPTDTRLKFAVAAIYNRFEITASYAHGLTNYVSALNNNSSTAYHVHSELISFGIGYRIL